MLFFAYLTLATIFNLISHVTAYHYDDRYVAWNLNTNRNAQTPLDFAGQWEGHKFHPSPENWRFPFYTLFLDRFVNGDPTNDNINGTLFEHDITSNQMRHGGDLQGLVDTLDYLVGMGIKGLYIAGSPFLNAPWTYDSYSPLDLSILDQHWGTIETWRYAIQEIHARGMYVVLDNTFATMGDLIGFQGYLNDTAPFRTQEHKVQWKGSRQYNDFGIGNTYNSTCQYPKFWLETGYPVTEDVVRQFTGCYDSDFDQYGDTEAFGVYPDWRRQLTKFASVQDRLREWHQPVRQKLENFYCMAIAQLDIDGYRYDKATQSTVEAMGFMNHALRKCAAKYGKNNFFLPGEITGGNVFGSVYIGRGRQPDMLPENLTQAVSLSSSSDRKYFIRDDGYQGLDAGAFHYTTYRTMTRFLGMDGNLEAGYDSPRNWVDQWNNMLMTNDFVNANTGKFDPRHMYGVTNQDVFRWGAIRQGVERQLLGHFVTAMLLPGMPLLLWGEEQAFYILDSTAPNYIFGRQPISASTAWMSHGCYLLDPPSTQYYQMPVEAARSGCKDHTQMQDHRDPTHPVRNILRHMFWLRDQYPVLNDGMFLQQLSNQTGEVILRGSSDVPTEYGIWSVMKSQFPGMQNLSASGVNGDVKIWLVYSNINETKTFTFDCADTATDRSLRSLIAPFDAGTTVRNLFYPFDEITLKSSATKLGIDGSTQFNGCLDSLNMAPYGYRAYVPKERWVGPRPMLTAFSPGHDTRLVSTTNSTAGEDIPIELRFSEDMNCDSITNSISFNSTTLTKVAPKIKAGSVSCATIPVANTSMHVGSLPSKFSWSATLTGVQHGIHAVTLSSPLAARDASTNAVERLLFRIGSTDNPVVFPLAANYSSTLLQQRGSDLVLHHNAAGADQWRYSTNWGTTFSDWQPYTGQDGVITRQAWTGTDLQSWEGDHVRVEYFSRLAGTSDIVQQGDLHDNHHARRFPHLFWNGPYNQYGYDAGLENQFRLVNDSRWEYDFTAEWVNPGVAAQVNVWGVNPDGKPDQSFVYGDVDGDSVLDRLPPSSLTDVTINITAKPPMPFIGWKIIIDDSSNRFTLIPSGNMKPQLALYILLWIVPIIGGSLAVWIYMWSFYGVKFNEIGVSDKTNMFALGFKSLFQRHEKLSDHEKDVPTVGYPDESINRSVEKSSKRSSPVLDEPMPSFIQAETAVVAQDKPRTVLIATMEYDIEDWAIKIKIGGLGVMAQLMGKNLAHQNLIWVVPCVGDVEYPEDDRAEPMQITIMDNPYEVKVQYHTLRNITYVLLDAPVFRAQSKAEPYPARMDDMPSAVYYSAWNQCIAQTIDRFPIDLYHINDYHGTIAPLYILPRTIPCCLSLHNAEFQGLWPMKTKRGISEVCSVFNLPIEVVQKYVQFGEVFNLLHAGASILREHQDGFGSVGVSKKYGKRAFARYPIFWGLKKIGQLPNPDPSDTAEWDKKLPKESDITVDPEFEASRGDLRRQAQEWAQLDINPNAELFVFVGRWSMQKGIDLIADVFPSLLESNPNVQLITVGPVIDLYGKFAAAKLDRMMALYPGRVMSKPVFTALPPYIFSGAEFALIPSRDEPFGLVAVEFGRKGALGVGSRVGGLGQMPGFWYTVESMSTSHLTRQFKLAIKEALATKQSTRALMRARSAKQRFPVAQWVEDLEMLQSTSIRLHDEVAAKKRAGSYTTSARRKHSKPNTAHQSRANSPVSSSLALRSLFNSSDPRIKPNLLKKRNKDPLELKPLDPRSPSPTRGLGHLAQRTPMSMVHPSPLGIHEPQTYSTEPQDPNSANWYRYTDEANHYPNSAQPTLLSPAYNYSRASVASKYSSGVSAPDSFLEPPPMHRDYTGADSPTLSAFNFDISRPVSPSGSEFESEPHTPDPWAPTFKPQYNDQKPFSTLLTAPSELEIDRVVGNKTDYELQKVDPFFTDVTGLYYRVFEKKLEDLSGKNSEKMCIEEFLIKSEKEWFDNFRAAKIGRLAVGQTPRPSMDDARSIMSATFPSRPSTPVYGDATRNASFAPPYGALPEAELTDEFLLGKDFKPATGIEKYMQYRVLTWPVYAYLLAFGQIIAANSYQITLLTGEVGQAASKLYVVASIYLATSVMWWVLYRRFQSRLVLSVPFLFYGAAFLFIAVAHFAPTINSRGWVQNMGTACYAVASSSGSLYFALNFGDEGGAQTKTWVYRACIIQGTQQIYVVALWAWGSYLSRRNADGLLSSVPVTGSWKITAICIPICVFLWAVGTVIWIGLPSYYRQHPGAIPSFYAGISRRKIVLWFFLTIVVQNFFLSAPYGRNWSFLFSSTVTSAWAIVGLCVVFFIIIWSVGLFGIAQLSKAHPWLLPLFAIGLGAPRWAQIWWGTSGVGLYLPWAAGGSVGSALVSRSLWLWLGTLDALQGVGLGMILLMTMTRVHIAFTLTAAQVLGSMATMIARAVAPNNIGPGPISPNISKGLWTMNEAWFWIGLAANLGVCVGFLLFFRKEQLTKP